MLIDHQQPFGSDLSFACLPKHHPPICHWNLALIKNSYFWTSHIENHLNYIFLLHMAETENPTQIGLVLKKKKQSVLHVLCCKPSSVIGGDVNDNEWKGATNDNERDKR